jgi:hypothetical protein
VHVCVHVCACVCMCVHVCACVCMCVHVCACVCMCVNVCACVCMCVHVCACVCMCVHACACVCMCVHVCACVCMCVHVCAFCSCCTLYWCVPGIFTCAMQVRAWRSWPVTAGFYQSPWIPMGVSNGRLYTEVAHGCVPLNVVGIPWCRSGTCVRVSVVCVNVWRVTSFSFPSVCSLCVPLCLMYKCMCVCE